MSQSVYKKRIYLLCGILFSLLQGIRFFSVRNYLYTQEKHRQCTWMRRQFLLSLRIYLPFTALYSVISVTVLMPKLSLQLNKACKLIRCKSRPSFMSWKTRELFTYPDFLEVCNNCCFTTLVIVHRLRQACILYTRLEVWHFIRGRSRVEIWITETGYTDKDFPWLSSVPPYKCRSNVSYQATNSSFHILSVIIFTTVLTFVVLCFI